MGTPCALEAAPGLKPNLFDARTDPLGPGIPPAPIALPAGGRRGTLSRIRARLHRGQGARAGGSRDARAPGGTSRSAAHGLHDAQSPRARPRRADAPGGGAVSHPGRALELRAHRRDGLPDRTVAALPIFERAEVLAVRSTVRGDGSLAGTRVRRTRPEPACLA